MKKRIQTLGALLLALALSLSFALPVSAAGGGADSRVDAAAEIAVDAVMNSVQATQVDWAVWQNGEIISSGSRKAEMDTSGSHVEGEGDAYCIGSISKIYTTVAVMKLAEEGKLNLDKPVVTYLPAFKMADPRYKDITVRMLLNHSSGLMGSSFSSALLFDDYSAQATSTLLQQLSTQRLKADPGAFSVYCNDGFTLAQLVVEAVSGVSFMEFLRTRILEPAGLKETWSPAGSFEGRRVKIYDPGVEEALPRDCLGVVGAGGLYATAKDVAAFGGALTDDTLLKKTSRDAMAAPEYKNGLWPDENYPNSMAFSLGWDNAEWYPFAQNDMTALVKGGDTLYYHAGLVVLPEQKMAAAVLSAGGSSVYNEMAASQMLIAALGDKGTEVAQIRFKLPSAQRAALPAELKDCGGYYGSQLDLHVKLDEDGTMTMRYPSTPDLPVQTFRYYDDGTFRNESGSAALRIVKEKNGQTYLYQWTFSILSGLGNLPGSTYAAMKLPDNPVSPELQARWDDLMNRAVLPMNERYSSQTYLSLSSLLEVKENKVENAPGYEGVLRIADENHLRYELQIPGNAGRDGSDVEVRQDAKGINWYYLSNGSVCMDIAGVPEISTGKDNSVACTIQSDGYARWYKVGAAAGKVMTVQVPREAGFWVYGEKGLVEASSVLNGADTVTLPKNGLIVFAGNPGAKFQLSFQED